MGKSGSLCAKPVSPMPQYYVNWRMFNWFPEIMHNNVYHEMFISDVGQTVAQEPIFYYYWQVLIRGPFKVFGAWENP